MSALMVRNFIKKGKLFSRVTVDRENYGIMSRSGRALASRGREVPELQPLAPVRDASGLFYNKFLLNNVEVLYRFAKETPAGENPHVFLIDTKVAESIHVPMSNVYTTVDVADAV